ncbi:hypothetical protein ACE193_17895 [Bernardetia sp. OM2101]|uniref:hypothetical protein n=1 Tax=Bernardetia sp. OM2101 TaxID=3344876 RepID=UPI0035CE8966
MKKSIFSYFSYLVLLLLAVGTLSSCDGTTDGVDPAPTITINPTSATIDVGQQADFTYTVISEKNLDEIRIISRNVTQQTITDFTNNDSHNGSFSFIGDIADAGTTVTVTIEAVDRDGNRSSKSADISINEATVPVDPIAIDAFPAVLLGAQDNASTGSFLDANTGIVYTIANARANAAKVDMAYLQGSASNNQGAVIGSLSDASVESVFSTNDGSWSTRNNTRFKNTSLSEANFNAITDGSELTAAYAAGTEPDVVNGNQSEGSASRVNQLTAGKVFAFRTTAGKDGLAYVVSVDAGNTGTITLNVKIVE